MIASLTATAAAQQYPQPTAAQLPGITKDNARHFGSAPEDGGPMAKDLSAALTAKDIDKAVKKVADWQLKESEPYFDRIWTWSVLYTGFMAASASTGDPKYKNAMMGMGRKYNFELRNRLPNADDQSVGSTYLDLYFSQPVAEQDQKLVLPTKADLDAVEPLKTLAHDETKIPWWWCDALFMAPAVWAEMGRETGDPKYVSYLNTQWHQTYDLLWDKDEHLYARDATYKDKREANGKKIFWSRGEGWVLGGLARVLEQLPAADPARAFYVQNMQEMSARVAELQDAKTGLWHAGLLDPGTYPLDEVSGSALFVYGMAYGVNHGYLDRAKYEPIIARAWKGILGHVYADGRLGCIQQTGPEPAFYYPTSSYTYGVGGFLLAGAELKTMAASPKHAVKAGNSGRGVR